MPAFHEADYYLALRRARRAWEASQPQLVLEGVLEQADAGTTVLVASACSSPWPSPCASPAAGSTPTKEEPS